MAIFNGEAVGQVRVVGSHDGSTAELMSLWVGSEARGHGLGTALANACWDWLQATAPGEPLRLCVRATTAHSLYERLGFVFVSVDAADKSEDVLIKLPAR